MKQRLIRLGRRWVSGSRLLLGFFAGLLTGVVDRIDKRLKKHCAHPDLRLQLSTFCGRYQGWHNCPDCGFDKAVTVCVECGSPDVPAGSTFGALCAKCVHKYGDADDYD